MKNLKQKGCETSYLHGHVRRCGTWAGLAAGQLKAAPRSRLLHLYNTDLRDRWAECESPGCLCHRVSCPTYEDMLLLWASWKPTCKTLVAYSKTQRMIITALFKETFQERFKSRCTSTRGKEINCFEPNIKNLIGPIYISRAQFEMVKFSGSSL